MFELNEGSKSFVSSVFDLGFPLQPSVEVESKVLDGIDTESLVVVTSFKHWKIMMFDLRLLRYPMGIVLH